MFRRNGSNASGLRGPRDPEAVIRDSQDTSKTASPLSRDGDASKDPAAGVPLPSSPINIPPPPPTLRLDLGPPTMLSPFKPTESDIAEIKTLQDPENITTGVPLSCLLDWNSPGQLRRGIVAAGGQLPKMEENEYPDQQHRSKPRPPAANEQDDVFGQHLPTVESSNRVLLKGPPDSSRQHLPAHLTTECDDVIDLLRPRWVPVPEPVIESAACDHPPDHTLPSAIPNQTPDSVKRENAACTELKTTLSMPSASSTAVAKARNEHVSSSLDSSNESIVELNLPSPQLPITSKVASCVSEPPDHVKLIVDCVEDCNASTKAEVIFAQEKYRDSLAELEGGLAFESLEPSVVQHVEQNPFVGGPGTPGSALRRSDSVKTMKCSEKSDRDFVMSEIQKKATYMAKNSGVNPTRGSNGSQKHIKHIKERQDSLFSDTEQIIVHANGPPSPERRVNLPLRPKAATTNSSSFDSRMFKPILDRVAANNSNIFRPGSDPSLRQKYFPHAAVAENRSVDHQRQPSLDSDDAAPGNTEPGAAVGVFERTVEQPSPLHIRKQSSTAAVDMSPLPQTPVSTSSQSAPGSSPHRTPSMGDRKEFDRQRADRNARYSAIYSGEHEAMQDLDAALQLAEFRNAGPDFEGLTPEREKKGKASGSCKNSMPVGRGTPEGNRIGSACQTEKKRKSIMEFLMD